MKKRLYCTALAALTFFAIAAQDSLSSKNKRYFDIDKNIDIFNSVLRNLDMFYVDSLETNSLVQRTIANMLAGLDPYTEYYSEEDVSDLRFLTTGEYAGIGAIISYNDKKVIINEPYEGLPAAKAGLKAGDHILEIDGQDMRKSSVKEVSDKLKGTPGTTITIEIRRPGEQKSRKIPVLREKITIPAVTYSTIADGNVGYLHFGGFTDKSSEEFKRTVLDLKAKGATSLVIDLRGNGGGILDEAVNIVNLFVPKSVEIVSTKGKVRQWDRTYRTQNQPIDTIIPLTVLIDTGSASASEITAGALQDFDRAVIIGNRSYGKGLVQTPRSLPYGGNIKITTSKYYIPSGRCIQALDYSHRNPDGSVARVPDSLTNLFYTKNGRPVRDGGGITPDISIAQERPGTITYYLMVDNIVFDFVTQWVQKHTDIAPAGQFELSDADYEAFKAFVKSKDFQYDRMSEKTMQSLKEIMDFEGYMKTAGDEFKALESKLVPDLDRDLETFKTDIKDLITEEIIQRYYYKKGVLIHELVKDKAYLKAREVLNDKEMYKNILNPTKLPPAEEIKEKLPRRYS
ncbi:MAG: S41 family peptidase [Dysgonamonadaceae bacterium]|jgi:carboxyl-terminal processing protease|nr:S41 family peptidase [Dysgonamonadaceae bacterium]